MNNLFTKIRDKHALWYKGIVFALCVCVCAYLLPKHTYLSIQHTSVGDLWLNEDVVSPFDFLVKKTNEEIYLEKNNSKQQIPYFKKISQDIDSLVSVFQLVSSKQIKTVKSALDSAYSFGVLFSMPKELDADSVIYVINNNEVHLIKKDELLDKNRLTSFLLDRIKDKELVLRIVLLSPSNLVYDQALSVEMSTDITESQYIYKSKILKGDILIHKNDIISEEQNNILASYNTELKHREELESIWPIVFGQLLACILILGIMMLFLAFFRKTIFSQNTQVTFIFLIIILIVLATSVIYRYNTSFINAVPFCLVPILIRVFFDSRTSLFNFLNIILLCAFFTSDKFEFVFIQLIAGIGTIFSVADMGRRSKLFMSALLAFVFYILSYIAYHLINNTTQAISNINNYVPFLISSVCVLFSFPLIYIFEKLFGFTSDFTLLELCDLNSPLLRQLSQKIPGTFQHSLQVANLAEEACYKIGGNPLLVRTGAMYHDIGKMENPRFFTENQVGEVSPHDDLSSEESAQIIIDHVIKGIEIAKENKLPETVIDFIRTHHGTTATRFFLYNYKKEHEGEIINEDLFRYPGPIPFSKETAILMMADGVEASSRSLKKYDAVAIDELVDKIINHQINENQFMNADITFRDINQIKKIFKKRLMNIYHVRIEYPR